MAPVPAWSQEVSRLRYPHLTVELTFDSAEATLSLCMSWIDESSSCMEPERACLKSVEKGCLGSEVREREAGRGSGIRSLSATLMRTGTEHISVCRPLGCVSRPVYLQC